MVARITRHADSITLISTTYRPMVVECRTIRLDDSLNYMYIYILCNPDC